MNKFSKSLLVAISLVGFGAGAMAATTPAQCYAAKVAANLKIYQSAVAVCNNTANQQLGKLGSAVVNARMRGPSTYAAFRSAVGALGVSVPSATFAELATAAGWNNYVNRVNGAATTALNANYSRCTSTAEGAYNAMNASAKASCGR